MLGFEALKSSKSSPPQRNVAKPTNVASAPQVAFARVPVRRFGESQETTARLDSLAVEEPLEIRIACESDGLAERAVAVTMRTPGHDVELAVGFLRTEGIVERREDVAACMVPARPRATWCAWSSRRGARVDLARARPALLRELELRRLRQGVHRRRAGPAYVRAPLPPGGPLLEARVVHAHARRRCGARRPAFDETGGLHAAGLFDRTGRLE